MPISKKRKKSSKGKNVKKNRLNQASMRNLLYRKDYTLMEAYDLQESIEVFEDLLNTSKEQFKDIEGATDTMHKRLVMLTALEGIYKNLNTNGDDNETVVISYKKHKSLLRIVPFIHNDNTLIISQINYMNYNGSGDCIQPLTPITYLADILNVDLVFPAYVTGDVQEEMFRTFGFVDSDYPAETGQKIMLRKSRRPLIDCIIGMDKNLNLSKYYPNEENRDNIYLSKGDKYRLCEDIYNEELNTNISHMNNSSEDIYSMVQWIYNSSNIGLKEYTHRDAIADMRLESLNVEDTFKKIYPDYKEFNEDKYNRLYKHLLVNESTHILFQS